MCTIHKLPCKCECSAHKLCVCVCQVLYLVEPIDEVAIQNLAEYGDKKFVDVSREGIDLGADDDTKKKVSLQYMCSTDTFTQSINQSVTYRTRPWDQQGGNRVLKQTTKLSSEL